MADFFQVFTDPTVVLWVQCVALSNFRFEHAGGDGSGLNSIRYLKREQDYLPSILFCLNALPEIIMKRSRFQNFENIQVFRENAK